MAFSRELWIDGYHRSLPEKKLLVLDSAQDIDDCYGKFLYCPCDRDLVLDCRALSEIRVLELLKFIEEYKGNLILMARDPIPGPISSRFYCVYKSVGDVSGTFLEVRLRKFKGHAIDKIKQLFGVGGKDE